MSLPLDDRSTPAAQASKLSLAASRTLFATILFAACSGGSELFLPGDGGAARIEVIHGNGQSGRVGESLSDSLVFEVSDAQLRPIQGVRVAFELTAAGPGADVLPDTAETDADGHVYTRVVLGTTIGVQVGQARVVGPEDSQAPSTEFQVTALPENANEMAAFAGDNQTAPVGSTLPQPLVVQVKDAFGNPVPGIPIAWSAEGGGSVSEASSVTDGEGKAAVQRTLGPTAGPQATVARSEGLAGSPVTFAHTATAGSASTLSLISGNGQTAQVGSRLPADLVVRLVDEIGNGVPNTAVTWIVSTGGGSVTPETGITDAAGYASAQYTLGLAPGQNRVDAVVSGVGVVNFTATGTAAAPAALAIVVQPSSSARNGQPLARQPVIQVRDAGGGNASTPGIAVTAQLSGGTGELQGTRQRVTDASGRATFTDLAIVGAQGNRVLVFTAPGFGGATSNPIDVSAAPTSTTITSDSPDPSTAGAVVTVAFRVEASGLIPSGSVTVTDGNQSCTGTLSGGSGSCQLALSTVGQRTLRATYAGAAGLGGSSDTEGHQVNAPPAGNNPPNADYNWDCDGLACRFTDASTDRDGSVVGWNWNFGDGTTSTVREPTHTFRGPGTYTVTLIATDDDGASDQSTATVEVEAPPPANQAPTAGFTFSCNQLACTFNSDASRDNDGRISSHSWDFGDGGRSGDRNPRHTYAAGGTYNVTLTVTDDDGATDSETHQVTVSTPANQPPTAAFTADCGVLRCSFNSDGSTDSDGQITSYAWNFGDGQGSSDRNPSHTYSTAGNYDVTLTVTDDDGATGVVTRQVTVSPQPNEAPDADYNWSCNDLTCQFTDASDDDDGAVTGWNWNFGDGTPTSNEQNPTHTFPREGEYTVTLTVTDNGGATDASTARVRVNEPPNQAPTAAFTPPSGCIAGQPCQFTDQSTDDRGIVRWEWDFDDEDDDDSDQPNPAYIFSEGGTFDVRLRVFDAEEERGEVIHEVVVGEPANDASTAQIGSIICTGMHCGYTDGSTDPQGAQTIAQWSWVFGDETGSNSRNPSHDYATAGTYTVTLTVADTRGAVSPTAAQETISVVAPESDGLIARRPPS